MPSYGDLINEAISTLAGHTTDVPAMGTLTSPVGTTDTTLSLDFGQNPGASRPNGLIEVDTELMVVSSYNPQTGVATVPPWGRGQRGTTAKTHPAGSMVTVRPRYPRATVGRAINQVIQGVTPDLYGVADMLITLNGTLPAVSYPLPANALRVLRIEEDVAGAVEYRQVVQNWTVAPKASGLELELHNRLFHGWSPRVLTVTYATNPGLLVNESDDYATVTTLDAGTSDLVVLGALARLVLSAESARTQVSTVEASARDDKIPTGSASSLAKTWLALYQQRLQAERNALQTRFPLTLIHRTRS